MITDHNELLFANNYLSTNDVLLEPTSGVLSSRKEADVDATIIYNSPMDTVASDSLGEQLLVTNQAYVTCRFFSEKERLVSLNRFYNKNNFWFTVGASLDDFDLLDSWWYKKQSLTEDRIRINIAVDVAHGDTTVMLALYNKYKGAPWVKNLMSGTVATPTSAYNVYCAGCTHIRVGIGPGSACTTRIVTGCGVPNLSAVYNIYSAFENMPFNTRPILIADGGIKSTGDIAKYLSAGASGVMLGNLLSKCQESPGWVKSWFKFFLNRFTFGLFFKNYYYKQYRGQASKEFQQEMLGLDPCAPEGIQGPKSNVKYSYASFYANFAISLSSSLSYLGLRNVKDLSPNKVRFLKITPNGYKESLPHLLSK